MSAFFFHRLQVWPSVSYKPGSRQVDIANVDLR